MDFNLVLSVEYSVIKKHHTFIHQMPTSLSSYILNLFLLKDLRVSKKNVDNFISIDYIIYHMRGKDENHIIPQVIQIESF